MKKFAFLFIMLWSVIAFFLHSCNKMDSFDLKTVMVLNENWKFQMKGDTSWLPAKVPGCVHTDLLINDKIKDPFYRDNEKDLQWIDKKDWIYSCNFELKIEQISHDQIYIRFQGLDTYTKVFLNGQLLLETNNMFRTWKADIKELVVEGTNNLEIEFLSPIRIGLKKLEELGYDLPAVNDQSENGGLGNKRVSVFTRKAPYHYGWDWGPRFVTSGIWRPVEIVMTDHPEIQDVHYKQVYISEETANIDAVVNIKTSRSGNYKLIIQSDKNSKKLASSAVHLEEGVNQFVLPFLIKDPELWWPNGMGDQHQYVFNTLLSKNDVIIDTLTNTIGLREIELVRDPDSTGTSFYFRVNGKNVFSKGANYIPNDNFLNRVTDDKYQYIVKSAANANMNTIRVWGGGIYENDIFYDLCDKYGLLVWQDFMFACSMYPGDEAFLENVRQEAIDNVKRLRNHASLALWCGNNEIDAAWCEGIPGCGWNWKEKYNKKLQKVIWHSYDTLFHKILPHVVEQYDGFTEYWPSSPQADWGVHANYESTSGDQHFWGVWHGKLPFSAFYDYVGRFMSEYGFQSFPSVRSIKKFTLPEDREVESDVMQAHQRSGRGNALIMKYIEDLYPVPEKFEEQIYIGQILQAEGIKQAIHAHRAHKPYCMGTLYWQLNDCWPSASWSSIDYYNSWKALHYYVKKAYQPVILAFIPDKEKINVSICSDRFDDADVKLRLTIKNFEGKILEEKIIDSQLSPEKSIVTVKIDKDDLMGKYNPREIYMEARLIENNELLAKELHFLVPPKNLNLPAAKIVVQMKEKENRLTIKLKSKKLVRNVFLDFDDYHANFSDNYFDLSPGEEVEINCNVDEEYSLSENELKIISLNDILNR